MASNEEKLGVTPHLSPLPSGGEGGGKGVSGLKSEVWNSFQLCR